MEKKKMLNNKMLRLILIASMCIVSIGGVFLGLVKWGFPLSDKEILDSAIRKEFMFEELHLRKRTATKILMRDHMLEDYMSFARQEADIVQGARQMRYVNSRSSNSLKSTIYYWNWKLNE